MARVSKQRAAAAAGAVFLLLLGLYLFHRVRGASGDKEGRLGPPEQAFKYLEKGRLAQVSRLRAKGALDPRNNAGAAGSNALGGRPGGAGSDDADASQMRGAAGGRFALVQGMAGPGPVEGAGSEVPRGAAAPAAGTAGAGRLERGPGNDAGGKAALGIIAGAGGNAGNSASVEPGNGAGAGHMAAAGKAAGGGRSGALGEGELSGKLGSLTDRLTGLSGGRDGAGGSTGKKTETPSVEGETVYHYISDDVVNVYSDMEGLESQDIKTVGGKKLRLGTQLLKGEKVTINGPVRGGMVEVYVPGQDMRGWIPASALSGDRGLAKSFPVRKIAPGRGPKASNPLREAFVQETAKLEGVPYVWGGRSPRGVDCSGLVQLAASYVGLGRFVPRTSRQQKANSRPVHPRDLRRGDLVFTSKRRDRRISHVVVYLGNGMIREAPRTGSVVQSRNFARRFGFDPSQVQDYDHNSGVKHGKYYLFFGTYFK